MATIKKAKPHHSYQEDRILIAWVKRARMWCRTTFLNGNQTQEWSTTVYRSN